LSNDFTLGQNGIGHTSSLLSVVGQSAKVRGHFQNKGPPMIFVKEDLKEVKLAKVHQNPPKHHPLEAHYVLYFYEKPPI